jgi:hypothetical protein
VSRPARIALIAAAILVFAAVTLLVGRVLGASTAARNEAVDVVKAQARGDADAVVSRISGCRSDPACRARTQAQVRRLRDPRDVRILRVDNVNHLSLGSRTDNVRVVWKSRHRLPTVQCVRVRRSGDPLAGYDIEVLVLGAPIGRESACPS